MEQAARLLVSVENANGDPVTRFDVELREVSTETLHAMASTETPGRHTQKVSRQGSTISASAPAEVICGPKLVR